MLRDSLGPSCIIDFSKLHDVDISALMACVMDNGLVITKRINDTAKVELLKGRGVAPEPAFVEDPDFRTIRFHDWYASLRDRICPPKAQGSLISLLFPSAVYLYDSYGLSCSKLILGCEMPTVPPLWLRTWLEQIDLLPFDKLSQLQDMLHNAKPVTCDTVYVLKSRMAELAAENSAPMEDFCLYPGIQKIDKATARGFAGERFKETGNAYSLMQPYLGNHKMLRLLIGICYHYKVSPDYLLLQDYSSFAVTETGRYYSPAKRQAMSMLLQTDAATRNAIVGFVLAQMQQRVLEGEEIPELAKEDLFVGENVLPHTLELLHDVESDPGDYKAPVKVREQQIVDSLKPKIYELLQLSSVPLSTTRLLEIVSGHARLAKRAIFEMEREGRICRDSDENSLAYWKIVPTKKSRK